jgi:hypothetical protein
MAALGLVRREAFNVYMLFYCRKPFVKGKSLDIQIAPNIKLMEAQSCIIEESNIN